ncbi:interaptin-like isoform X2 [Topomyia yanbarensis]|uniref:interaptin-like isoform X2 n=1 Tax=Topomyia yanbarensis TaxID=2498891 RepID=UPI00273AD444|nr:interaptin-like isoform X2 [Topomyia yanbarensis]
MDSGPENSTLQDNVVAAANVVLRDNPQQTRPECVDTSCRNREGGDCAKCGEPGQLNICLLEELNAQFEDRLRFIEQNGNDDKFKVEIYERWIHQLRLVNLDLLTTIKEMEKTCRDRVVIMKENYKKNLARYGSEAQARAKRDRDSLLEVIRRAYTTGSWNIEGIRFYDVDIEEIFGKKGDITVDSQHENRMDGPTISLNLAVSSNCQYENSEIDELRQTLDARNKQIEHLELLLDMKYPEKNFSFERENADDLESQHFNTEYSTSNKILLHQLRQMNCEKSKELDEQSMQIEKMHKQIRALESKLEEGESSVQLDSDMSASLADLKLDESDASNRKLLQQLQNLIRFKSGQLEASLKDNEVLREQIEYFKSQLDSQSNVDKQSLVNEIKDHYDRNRQLEKKLREYEQSLLESNAAVDHRNNVINQLRQDISSLKKSTFINIRELGTSTDTASVTSFGSAKSGSSVDTVIMRAISPTRDVRELETEQVLNFSKEFTVMSEQVRQLEATKQAQDDIIADQWNKLNSTESEYRILRDEYENSEKKLHLIRSEIAKLIKTIRESFQGHFPLPQTIPPIEELVSRSFVQVDVADLSSEMFENDKQILGVLQSHLNSVTRNSLLVIADQRELRKHIAALQQVNRTNGELLENLKNDRLAAERETESKETSIDSDIMTESSTETLAAQRLQVQNVLQGMAKEIAYLIGKDLSNDSLTSFAELDATPLHCLIDDLKQEIDAKDSLLQSKSDIIAQLEQRLCTREKELHRLKLRQESVEQDRLSYEKRIGNLQRALQDHDETIEKLKQQNRSLKQQLEDMKETLQTYKENIRQAIEEKASVEDECKNQLLTISNLRTAIEETKRSGSSSVNHLRAVIESLQSEVSTLSEQLNQAFRENLTKDNELDQHRDSNLQLRCQISELTRDSIELKDIVALVGAKRELEEQKQRHLVQIRNEMSNMQAQIANFQKEIACRQRDQDYLRFFRQKCAETEMEHQQELHRMRDEIESLSIQLASCEDTNIQHEQLLSQSNALQNTISELENHNEILRKAIQSYEGNNEQLQQELSTFQFQYDNLNQELENLKSACSEKDNKIISLNAEREKLLGDLNFHRRMCKCGFNTSAKERSKTPVSHSLQRQVVQKTLEATKAADALKQKTVELKKLENQYVEERVRLTEQTTDLFTQIGKLKGKNSNLEQSLFHKEELIERLQQSLRDITQRLTSKAEIAQSMETKNANLSQLLEKFREDSTVREKKLADELNNIRRSSQDQTNQLQQCENQIAWHRDELESLRGKFDSMLKERDALKQDIVELNCKLACSAGKESALCDVLKQLQDEVSDKTGRLTEVEENYRKIYQAYQHLKSFNEDLSKQNQVSRSHLENYKKLVEFKRQTIGTVELAQKFAEESRRRERAYLQKIAEQKQVIVHLRDDRIKLTEKLYDYHRDSLILNRKLEDYHQANIGRNMNTSFHQTFYPSEAYKLMRSSSDPNCKKNDELLHRVETTSNRILRTREFWHQGIKEILSPTRFAK